MSPRTASLLLLLPLLLACGDPSPEDCDPPSRAQAFEVGTGELCFERVPSGSVVPLISGPQGGYHVWLAIGCADCGREAHIRARVFGEDGAELPNLATEEIVELAGDEWPQHPGFQLGMPGDPFGDFEDPLPTGTRLRVVVEVLGATEPPLHSAEIDFVLGEIESWGGDGDGELNG